MQDTPKDLDKKRTDEKLLVSEMIALYCRRQHKTPKGTLCPECRQLHDYALMRIDKCPFMGDQDLLLGLQGALLPARHAGEDPHGDALGRPPDAAGAPGAVHPACGSHNPV